MQDKVEGLQERLDAYIAGDKTVVESLDTPDGGVKTKRCKSLIHAVRLNRLKVLFTYSVCTNDRQTNIM